MVLFVDCESRELKQWLAVLYKSGFSVLSVCPEAWNDPKPSWNFKLYGEDDRSFPGSPAEVLIWRIFFCKPKSQSDIVRQRYSYNAFIENITREPGDPELSGTTAEYLHADDSEIIIEYLRTAVINILNQE